MSELLDRRIGNLEQAVAAQESVVRDRGNLISELRRLDGLDQSSPPVEILKSPLDDNKWMVRLSPDRQPILYNKHVVRFHGEYQDGEGEWQYAHITPSSGTWYLWFNTIGDDAYCGYVVKESLLPRLLNRQQEEEVCRRPEVIILPLFTVPADLDISKIDHLYKDAIFLSGEERYAVFQTCAYYLQALENEEALARPELCYAVYNPIVTIKGIGGDVAVTFDNAMMGDWCDLGKYPEGAEDSSLLCIMCHIRGDAMAGAVLDSGDVAIHYAVNWIVRGILAYSNYAPSAGEGDVVNMFSFPVSGHNAMAVALFQFGYNDEDKLIGTTADQQFYKEKFAPYSQKHTELYNEQCTAASVLSMIKDTVSSAELAILVYSGHGSWDGDKKHSYALPTTPTTFLDASSVANVITSNAVGRVWLINDCCYGGGHFDTEYGDSQRNIARGITDEIVESVRSAGNGIQLLGWAGAPPELEGWTNSNGGIFMQALRGTFNADSTYEEQWEALNQQHGQSTFYKKSCNGFSEDKKLFT